MSHLETAAGAGGSATESTNGAIPDLAASERSWDARRGRPTSGTIMQLPSTDSRAIERGLRIPQWIWVLAGCGMGAGAVMLFLLTHHLLRLEGVAESAHSQRRTLAQVTRRLHTPIRELEAAFEAVFVDEDLSRLPVEKGPSFPASTVTESLRLPASVRSRIHGLGDDLHDAAELSASAGTWLRRKTQLGRSRATWRDAAEEALESARSRLGELTQRALEARGADGPRGREREVLPLAIRLRDAVHAAERDVLLIANETNARRVPKIRQGTERVLLLLHHLADELDAARGDGIRDPLRAAFADLQLALLGDAELSEERPGLIGAQRSWLQHAERGECLRGALRAQLDRLHHGRSQLGRLLAQEIAESSHGVQAHLTKLWMVCIVVGGAVGVLFLMLAGGITRAARAQIRDLLSARAAAAQAVRAQGLFLANMSHEIRTPMNGVLGMAEMLESTPLTEEQRQTTRTIRTSAEALLTVINDVLDFSKIQAGRLELDNADFDLRNTVQDALDLLRHLAADQGLGLLCHVDHRVPRGVHGDGGRLRQVLLNLGGNAIKFTKEGHVTVLVHVLSLHRDVIRLQLSVSDTGVGISGDALDRLFRPFSQADATTTRRYGGTGLGLTISKRLVQLMGGDISVRSTVGVGSTFTFTLALAPASAELDDPPRDLSGWSALVVHRDEERAQSLAAALAADHLAFDVACSAEAARTVLRRARQSGHRFDLALVDGELADLERLLRTLAAGDEPGPACLLLGGDGETAAAARLPADVPNPALLEAVRRVLGAARPTPLLPTSEDGDDDVPQPLGLRVLVAEDNRVNQRVLRAMLARLGCETEVADNGREALDAIRQRPFDAVLMDCEMPELDGFAATRELRALPGSERTLPVIALTANVLPADRKACLEAGMDQFLPKPVATDRLREVLAQVRTMREAARTG